VKQQFIAEKTTKKSKAKGGKPGLNVSKGPTQAEIKAALKGASDRFARLGLVTNVLRGSGRVRYDHFLANGFPAWKGTGYYYARYRPGFGSVLLGLFIFVGGGGHYFALYMSWKRQREFVERYIKFARRTAWGSDTLNVPGLEGQLAGTATPPTQDSDADGPQLPRNRRERRMMEKENKKDKEDKKVKKAKKASPAATPPSGATGRKKRVVAENGKILVVDQVGNVYLEQEDEEGQTQEFLLDPNELLAPTIRDTALYRMPIWAYNRALGLVNKSPKVEEDTSSDDEVHDVEPEASSSAVAGKDSSTEAEDYELLEKSQTVGNGKKAAKRKGGNGR
jgi:hypothetical protein